MKTYPSAPNGDHVIRRSSKDKSFLKTTNAGLLQLKLCDWEPALAVPVIPSLIHCSDIFTCYNVFPLQARKHLVWQNTAGLRLFQIQSCWSTATNMAVAKKWGDGVFKEKWWLQTTSNTIHRIGFILWMYSTGYVWIHSLGRDTYLSSKCRGGGCLIQNENRRKLIPNGTKTAMDKATRLVCIQCIHHMNMPLNTGKLAIARESLPGERRERRGGRGAGERVGVAHSPTSTQMEIICVSTRGPVHILL